MKPVEEMNAMEVCAYLVAKASRKEISEDEIRRLYDIHCAKLKKELAEKNARRKNETADCLSENPDGRRV